MRSVIDRGTGRYAQTLKHTLAFYQTHRKTTHQTAAFRATHPLLLPDYCFSFVCCPLTSPALWRLFCLFFIKCESWRQKAIFLHTHYIGFNFPKLPVQILIKSQTWSGEMMSCSLNLSLVCWSFGALWLIASCNLSVDIPSLWNQLFPCLKPLLGSIC